MSCPIEAVPDAPLFCGPSSDQELRSFLCLNTYLTNCFSRMIVAVVLVVSEHGWKYANYNIPTMVVV